MTELIALIVGLYLGYHLRRWRLRAMLKKKQTAIELAIVSREFRDIVEEKKET